MHVPVTVSLKFPRAISIEQGVFPYILNGRFMCLLLCNVIGDSMLKGKNMFYLSTSSVILSFILSHVKVHTSLGINFHSLGN